MKRRIDVTRSEIIAGQGEVVLNSQTDNACLVIVAYDAVKKIGCLGHAVFEDMDGLHRTCCSVMRGISDAVDEMIKDMLLLGADADNIEITLITGENVPHQKNDPGYNGRVDSALECLRQRHIKCRQDSICDVGDSHVAFDVESGKVVFR